MQRSGVSHRDRVMAALGSVVRLSRTWFIRLRQETEGDRSAGLRVGSHDLPVLHLQHNSSRRPRRHLHSHSLLRQNLSIEDEIDGAWKLVHANFSPVS